MKDGKDLFGEVLMWLVGAGMSLAILYVILLLVKAIVKLWA